MNNGTAAASAVPDDVRRAREDADRREVIAQTLVTSAEPDEDPVYAALLEPPPAVSLAPRDRSEAERAMAAEPCRADIPAEDCAQARAAMASDLVALADDATAACEGSHAKILRLQQQLRYGTENPADFRFGATRPEVAELLAVTRDQFSRRCTQPGAADPAAEAYYRRQRDSIQRVTPHS